MTNELFLKDMTEQEDRLAQLQFKKKKDIQFLASNGIESLSILDDSMLKQSNLIIGYVSNEGIVCKGRYANKDFSFPTNHSSSLIRVWLDYREHDDIKFHVNSDGKYHKLSEDNEGRSDEVLIVLLECPEFVQFSLYDSGLVYERVSHVFTTAIQMKKKMKTIAYSLLNQYFKGLPEYLKQLEDESDGDK